jgi:hypothetical protein
MDIRFLFLVIAISVIALLYYIILPKLNVTKHTGLVLRSVIFFAIIGYLSYDFYMKEKYSYLIVLALGSIAFIFMMISVKKKE